MYFVYRAYDPIKIGEEIYVTNGIESSMEHPRRVFKFSEETHSVLFPIYDWKDVLIAICFSIEEVEKVISEL